MSVKTISRSAGRSATAAAAYRASVRITDSRTGEVHDYRQKKGVESAQLILPPDAPAWASNRAKLWNAAEQNETRKNSTVAREFEIALPSELSPGERKRLAHDFAKEIVRRHGCAADVAIHAPGKGGDNRNHHAHILLTTRRLGIDGFTEKTRELDDRKTGEIDRWRERFSDLQNDRLSENGLDVRVDHRSFAKQGISSEPGRHNGPKLTALLRRGGRSYVEQNRASERLEAAAKEGLSALKLSELDKQIILLETDIGAAQKEAKRLTEKPLSMEDMRAKSRAIFKPKIDVNSSAASANFTAQAAQEFNRQK